MKYGLILLSLFLAGCSSTGAISVGSDSYMLTRTGLHSGVGTPDFVKNRVYEEADEFCLKESKKVEIIKLDIIKSEYVGPVKVSLQFKCAS